MAAVTRDRDKCPAVTLDLTSGTYTATVTISDLEPARAVTAAEQAAGVVTLDPVKVTAREPRALIDLAAKTVLAAAWSMSPDLTMGECATITVRVASELRRAMTALGVNV
jgi:hypothetical protein